MILYKLTDRNGMTTNNTKWEAGTTHILPDNPNPRLCTSDVLHAYTNANLGLLLNSLHANIADPRLWRAEGEVVVSDWSKVGCFELTVVQELDLPDWYASNRKEIAVRFAVLCARSVLHIYEQSYPSDRRVVKAVEAAEAYLLSPSAEAATWAASAAASAAKAAAESAEAAWAAAWAAAEAARAASAAVWAAQAAAVWAARAVWAAWAAARAAASSAVWAASAAAKADSAIDFGTLADKAVMDSSW